MKSYEVTIMAKVTKTVEVEADNDQDAEELAHEIFNTSCELGVPEAYDQETVLVKGIRK